MKRKIAAILAADVAGYSRLVAEDEEETLRRLHDYQGVFFSYVERAGGRVFKTAGDSVLAEFPSAVDALRCAIDVQESLRSRNLAYPMSRQMAYRIGLTIGDVVDQEGDLLGDGVNIAARLESLAQPGGICISKGMHDAVSSKLSAKYIDMGTHQIKNIPAPVHVFSVSVGGQGPTLSALTGADAAVGAQQRLRKVWSNPPFAVSVAGVMLASAALAYGVTRFFEPSTPAQHELPARVAVQSDRPPETNPAPVATAVPEKTPAKDRDTDKPPEAVAGETKPAVPKASVASSEETPPRSEALRSIRWTACNSDDTAAALMACKALVGESNTKGEDLALLLRRLGYAQRKNGETEAAISSFSESIKTSATADAYTNRGVSYFLKGQLNEAVADYDKAISLDPNYGDAWNNRAWTYYKSGRIKDALTDADKAVSLIGGKAYVWDTRGHIYEALGNLKSATSDFEKALSIDPGLVTSKAGLKRVAGR